MYKLKIITPHNVIHLLVDSVVDAEVQQIIQQSWAENVEYELCKSEDVVDSRYKRLVKVKDSEKHGKR